MKQLFLLCALLAMLASGCAPTRHRPRASWSGFHGPAYLPALHPQPRPR